MKSLLKKSLIFVLFASLCAPISADIGDWGTQNMMSFLQNTTAEIIQNSYSTEESDDPAIDSPPQKIFDHSSQTPTYTPSLALRKINLDSFVAKTRALDPAKANKLEALVASTDVIDGFDRGMQSVGLSVSNSADVYAVWWITIWQTANGANKSINGATYQAVSAQAAGVFAATPQFARVSDAQKQELAEAMLVQIILITTAINDTANNPTKLYAVRTNIMQGAAKSGLDLKAMTLTENGFVPIKQ